MVTPHTGGCQCGALRYEFTGKPRQLIVCHCHDCQKRSGSAFGMSLFLDADALRISEGEIRTYQRTAESGRQVTVGICENCGTQIYGRPEWRPDTIVLKAGTLDDTSWLVPDLHIWTASKQPWVIVPDGVEAHERQPS